VDLHQRTGVEAESVEQHPSHLVRRRCLDLEPNHLAESPLTQLLFDGCEEVVCFTLLDLDIRIARDPEEVCVDDFVPGEEHMEVFADQAFEEQDAPIAHMDQSPDDLRHLDAREESDASLWVSETHGD